MKKEIENIKKLYSLLLKYISGIDDLLKARFIDVYDKVKIHTTILKSSMNDIDKYYYMDNFEDEKKFDAYHLLNISWITLQKLYKELNFVIEEDYEITSSSESKNLLDNLKKLNSDYMKITLNIDIYNVDFLQTIGVESEDHLKLQKYFQRYDHSVPLYIYKITSLIDKYFKTGEVSKAKDIIDAVEVDKSFILKEKEWKNSLLSYGLVPENKLFLSVPDVKKYYFNTTDNESTVGLITFHRLLPTNNHINFFLPTKTWKATDPLTKEQIEGSKILEIMDVKKPVEKVFRMDTFKIEIENPDADKFICVEKINGIKPFRLLKHFYYLDPEDKSDTTAKPEDTISKSDTDKSDTKDKSGTEDKSDTTAKSDTKSDKPEDTKDKSETEDKSGGWTYDPTKDPKNPAFIEWKDRPENKEKYEQQQKEQKDRSDKPDKAKKEKSDKWVYDPTKDPKKPEFIEWKDRPENKEKYAQQQKDKGKKRPFKSFAPRAPPQVSQTPYVPKERLQKLLSNMGDRPNAYNKHLEDQIILSNNIKKSHPFIMDIKVGFDIINNIKATSNKIAQEFFTKVLSKKYKRVFDIDNDDLIILSNQIVKNVIKSLKIDLIDSHLYYMNDFQTLYTTEFLHVVKTETKNAGLDLKIYNHIIDKVHTFLFKPNSKFLKVPIELYKISEPK